MSNGLSDDLLPSELARFDEVCRFGQDKRDQVAETVALSFADDPIWQWIYGLDSTIPIETGIVLARLLVAQSTPADEIHGFRHFGAVALWTAPVIDEPNAPDQSIEERVAPLRSAFVEMMGDRIMLTGQLSEAMKQHRPQEPHWYLGILGTHPEQQNQGLGSRVLQTMLARCDRYGIPAYLESSNPRNYGFYQRHGFVEANELVVADAPPLLGFFRAAKS